VVRNLSKVAVPQDHRIDLYTVEVLVLINERFRTKLTEKQKAVLWSAAEQGEAGAATDSARTIRSPGAGHGTRQRDAPLATVTRWSSFRSPPARKQPIRSEPRAVAQA
jgi:hypothetical protein